MMKIQEFIEEIQKSFVGNPQIIYKVFCALLAGGHVLLEDIPGVGKTTLAKAFSQVLNLECKRIQFTPDVMPSDITGFTMLRPEDRAMVYQPGAVMCSLLLADEINRASSRTQSALLEAMEEYTVTVDGVTYPLPDPFMVIATQNPAGSSGTQLLPESQTDRFMLRLSIGYPDEEMEFTMLSRKNGLSEPTSLRTLADAETIREMRKKAAAVYLDDSIYRYILKLVRATRERPEISQGASPRCSVALTAVSQAAAWVSGRDYVIPEDVQSVYIDCVAHRLVMSSQAKRDRISPEMALEKILKDVQPPKLKVES